MSKWSIVGGLLCLSGVLMYGFQVISGLVGQAGDYDRICIYDLVKPESMDWLDSITWLHMDQVVDYIASAPLYLLLIVVGAIFLLISGFVKN